MNSDRPVGLVVKASASGAEGLEFESRLGQDFSGSSHTRDLKIGTPVTTLPGAWRYRIRQTNNRELHRGPALSFSGRRSEEGGVTVGIVCWLLGWLLNVPATC